jgi:hypothetical protein
MYDHYLTPQRQRGVYTKPLAQARTTQPKLIYHQDAIMTFDADSFLQASVVGANDTKIIPCPIGEFPGIVSKISPRQWQSKDGTQTGVALDVFWMVEDAGAKAATGRDEVIVKQGIMLDTTPQGGLDMSQGKNVALGRLREAVGKNDPSQPFSFAMLPGLMAKVSVAHREYNGDTFAEVKLVTKLS